MPSKLAVHFQDDLRVRKMNSIQHVLLSQDTGEIRRALQEPLEKPQALLAPSQTSGRNFPLVRRMQHMKHPQQNILKTTPKNTSYTLPSDGHVASVKRRSHSPVRREPLGSVVDSDLRPEDNIAARRGCSHERQSIMIDLTGDPDDEKLSKVDKFRKRADKIDRTVEPVNLEAIAKIGNEKLLAIKKAI